MQSRSASHVPVRMWMQSLAPCLLAAVCPNPLFAKAGIVHPLDAARRQRNSAQTLHCVLCRPAASRHIACAPFVRYEIAANRLAAEKDFARADLDQSRDHFHGCGFTRAVRTKIAGDFSRAAEKLTYLRRVRQRNAWRHCAAPAPSLPQPRVF